MCGLLNDNHVMMAIIDLGRVCSFPCRINGLLSRSRARSSDQVWIAATGIHRRSSVTQRCSITCQCFRYANTNDIHHAQHSYNRKAIRFISIGACHSSTRVSLAPEHSKLSPMSHLLGRSWYVFNILSPCTAILEVATCTHSESL